MLHEALAPLLDDDSRREIQRRRPGLALAALLAVALLSGLCGCSTVGGSSSSSGDLTSQAVKASSYEQVGQATSMVFAQKGYSMDFNSQKLLVFSKKGSAGSNLLYGGWPGIDSSVIDRVEVTVSEIIPGQFMLRCNASLVSNPGQGFFEDSRPVYKVRAGAYHSILKAVKKQLDSEAPPPAKP
jgi:hypothetical protein